MKKYILLTLTVLTLSSCVIDRRSPEIVSPSRLQDFCSSLLFYHDSRVSSGFLNLLAIDSFESLPEEEKNKPLYSAFRVTNEWQDGYKHYDGYGRILTDSKRLGQKGSIWANEHIKFNCTEDYDPSSGQGLWTFSSVSNYNMEGMEYVPGSCRLWIEDGTFLRFEFKVQGKGENGCTCIFYTK